MTEFSHQGRNAARPHRARNALTKRDLVNTIAERMHLRQQDVYDVVQRALDGIMEALKNGRRVEFREFGVFDVVTRKPRIGRNPHNPSAIVRIPPRRAIKFKPGRVMKLALRASLETRAP
jgi:nucleoid DNA-binding protein